MQHKPFTERDREIAHELSHKLERLFLPTQIKPLRRAAITLRHLFECECNGCTRDKLAFETWKDYDEAREQQMQWVEKRVATVEKRIDTLCKELNIIYYIQSDPRGCSLYLGTDSDNRYSTEGVAVY